jgi:hypothetical protein
MFMEMPLFGEHLINIFTFSMKKIIGISTYLDIGISPICISVKVPSVMFRNYL